MSTKLQINPDSPNGSLVDVNNSKLLHLTKSGKQNILEDVMSQSNYRDAANASDSPLNLSITKKINLAKLPSNNMSEEG